MTDAPTREAIYTARPTVQIDQQAYPMVSEQMEMLEMNEAEGGFSTLEMRISNLASDTQGMGNYAFENDRILRLGAQIKVYAGDETGPNEIFRGMITGLEAAFSSTAPPTLQVMAEDALLTGRLTRRTKVYENKTLDFIVRDIADTLHLTPTIDGLSQNVGTQAQINESGLAFLRRLLARYDADLQIVGDELHVSARKDVRRGTLELALPNELQSVRVMADLAHQVTAVTLTGWDAAQGSTISVSSTGANPGPGQGRKGADVLGQTALQSRSHHISHLGLNNQTEARALADAAFDERARRFVCVEATAEGNPALRVGTHVTLSGLGGRFDNTYYVVRVCHRFDLEHGYKTDFEAECAFLGRG
ncbi:MAG: hypothetical protein K8L91_09165 [Anaerolineae bacterium]|nr:hypothetical protein [Anaerolineae bacterium]